MQTVNMHEAKTRLSALVNTVLDGEEVVIAKAGNPLVRLVPYRERKTPRKPAPTPFSSEMPGEWGLNYYKEYPVATR